MSRQGRQNWGRWQKFDRAGELEKKFSTQPLKEGYNYAYEIKFEGALGRKARTEQEYEQDQVACRKKWIERQRGIDNTSRADLIAMLNNTAIDSFDATHYIDSEKFFDISEYPDQWREAHRTKDIEFLSLVYEKIPLISTYMGDNRDNVASIPMNIMHVIIQDKDLATAQAVKEQMPEFAFYMLVSSKGSLSGSLPFDEALRQARSAKNAGRLNDPSLHLLKIFQELMEDVSKDLGRRGELREGEQQFVKELINKAKDITRGIQPLRGESQGHAASAARSGRSRSRPEGEDCNRSDRSRSPVRGISPRERSRSPVGHEGRTSRSFEMQ